jgi:hypothetical protein
MAQNLKFEIHLADPMFLIFVYIENTIESQIL